MSEPYYSPLDPEYYEADVDELIKVLEKLPLGSRVTCNDVKNLTVSNSQGRYIGWIDIRRTGPQFNCIHEVP